MAHAAAALQSFRRESIGTRPSGLPLPLADDPGFLNALEDLDRGVYGFVADLSVSIPRPPLITQLVVPQAAKASRPSVGVSVWAASWIILAMLTGASAAGFAFHTRLSRVVEKWESAANSRTPTLSKVSVQ